MKSISPFKFGKDHWSLFGYVCSVCVGKEGVPDFRRMRCNPNTHPGLAHMPGWDSHYGTRLKGYFDHPKDVQFVLPEHDDWDCIDDLVAADLMELHGTGINPVFRLTKRGEAAMVALMKHKADGKGFAAFELDPELMERKF